MRMRRKSQTDEEYVESVRELVDHPRRDCIRHLWRAVVLFVIFLTLYVPVGDLVCQVPRSDEISKRVFQISMNQGMTAAFFLYLVIHNVIWAARAWNFRGYRAYRLMLGFLQRSEEQ